MEMAMPMMIMPMMVVRNTTILMAAPIVKMVAEAIRICWFWYRQAPKTLSFMLLVLMPRMMVMILMKVKNTYDSIFRVAQRARC